MGTKFINLTIEIMVCLFLYGCSLSPEITSPAYDKPNEKPVNKKVVSIKKESRYYYFVEAQLHKNKGNIDKAIQLMMKAIEQEPASLYLQRELAFLYLLQQDNLKALDVVEKIIAKDPNDVHSLIIYGRIKHVSKQLDDAKKAYERVVARDPKQEKIYILLGGLYMDEKDLNRALKVYGQLIQNFPGSYTGHFYIGKIQAKQGHLSEAEKSFKKTLELEPELETPRFELIEIYKKMAQPKNVIGMYNAILKKNPDNIKAATQLGYYYQQQGKKKNAEKILKDLGGRSVTDKEIIRQIVQLYIETKQYDVALVILSGMLKGAPNNSDIHYLAGVVFEGNDDKEMAIKHFKKVLPDSVFYQHSVANIPFLYKEQGKLDKAIAFLKDMIKNTPDNPLFPLYLGTFYEESEQFDKAEQVLKQGLKIDSSNVNLHFRLGVVYDLWGKKEASIESMKTVIRLDPQNAEALNYIGYTYADLGRNLDEAERLIKEALKYKHDDGYITDSLGWVYFKKGLFEKALNLLIKAVSLIPDDPIILEHLGDVYRKLNDKEKALEFYERSLLNKKRDKEPLEKKIRELTGLIETHGQ